MKRTLVLTSPHMTGDDVKYAQRVLKKHSAYYDGKADGEYGPLTAQAAYRAQYWMGYTTPKQTFGTALEKLLLGQAKPSGAQQKRIAERKKAASSKPLREKALAAMGKFVGLTEVPPGSNHVPEINSWWGGGDVAWCARSVSKAYITAGSKSFVRGRNYEYVPTIVGDARAGLARARTGARRPEPRVGELADHREQLDGRPEPESGRLGQHRLGDVRAHRARRLGGRRSGDVYEQRPARAALERDELDVGSGPDAGPGLRG